MNRTDKLRQALSFDHNANFDRETNNGRYLESHRLSPLHKVLCDAVEVLEKLQCNPKYLPNCSCHTVTAKTLAAIDAALEGVE